MSQLVRGVISRAKGAPVETTTIVIPDPGPGEAVVKIQACGVCHTDLHYREGGINDEFPFLLGHEAAGVVEAVGAGVTDVAPGDLRWDEPLVRVEVDDAYLGGHRPGKRGRGAAGKQPFVAAVSTSDDRRPRKIKLLPVKGFRKKEVKRLVSEHLASTARLVTDGLGCWTAAAAAGGATLKA